MNRQVRSLARFLIPESIRTILGAVWAIGYHGHSYKCPICGVHLRKFVSGGEAFPVLETLKVVGGGFRVNFQCPKCHSIDRERLLFVFLKTRTELISEVRTLLHVAPEKSTRRLLSSITGLDYITADLNARHVQFKMDLTNIEFPDEFVDMIICCHVLEHIEDDKKALAELQRILKPKGIAILQVPISLVLQRTYEDKSIKDPKARERAYGQWDHVRIYAMDFVSRVEAAGFTVETFDWTRHSGNFGGPSNTFGLNEYESLFLATKK